MWGTSIGLVLRRNSLERLVEGHFAVHSPPPFSKRQNRLRPKLLGADVIGDLGASVGVENNALVGMTIQDDYSLPGAAMNSCIRWR